MTWPEPSGDATKILVVCTANICRSPVAAEMIRQQCQALDVGVSVTSAGFLETGREADRTMMKLAAAGYGIDVSGHLSSVASAAWVAAADVVVTMERRHARNLVVLAPEAGHRVHTLLGLSAVADAAAAPGSLEQMLAAIDADRGPAGLIGDQAGDEIADPYGRSKRHYRKCLEQLAEATARASAFVASAR